MQQSAEVGGANDDEEQQAGDGESGGRFCQKDEQEMQAAEGTRSEIGDYEREAQGHEMS
jgi:hypothetical protein